MYRGPEVNVNDKGSIGAINVCPQPAQIKINVSGKGSIGVVNFQGQAPQLPSYEQSEGAPPSYEQSVGAPPAYAAAAAASDFSYSFFESLNAARREANLKQRAEQAKQKQEMAHRRLVERLREGEARKIESQQAQEAAARRLAERIREQEAELIAANPHWIDLQRQQLAEAEQLVADAPVADPHLEDNLRVIQAIYFKDDLETLRAQPALSSSSAAYLPSVAPSMSASSSASRAVNAFHINSGYTHTVAVGVAAQAANYNIVGDVALHSKP